MVAVSPKDFPQLLVFSRLVPETRNAGSLLLFRLLRNYPPERLLVIGPRPHPESETLACRYAALRNVWFSRLYRSRLWRLARSVATYGFGNEVSAKEAVRLMEGFRADVVLTVMEESQYYWAASRFASQRAVPLVLLVHDPVELFEPVYSWAVRRQRQRNAAVYRSAAARFCISPAMAERLHRDYGVGGDVLYPNRTEELIPRPLSESVALRTEGQLTIGYAGGLSYGYGEAIQALLPALKAADAVLRVYSAQVPDGLGRNIRYAGYAPSPLQTWERVKHECDVALLPYDWSPGFQDLYHLHFPSKLPEYLALRIPLLITGPEYAAGVAWGLANPHAALTVTDRSTEAIRRALVRLREHADLRVSLATQAFTAGNSQFDPVAIRLCFINRIKDLATK